MERSTRVGRSRLSACRNRSIPYQLRSSHVDNAEDGNPSRERTSSLALEKRDWEDAKCSVCMEFPHNAVLLLCSSHDKGCRPYMCGTSYRHSNCLDQFKKAYTKVQELETMMDEDTSNHGLFKPEAMELASCPLCRGQVKGWTVVEPARKYLNSKRRSCMQDDCSFAGTYKELQKHVRSAHPCAKPREVDPTLEQKWRRLEHERERQDVISTIRSSMPRSVVFGDYVIDMAGSDHDDSEEEDGDMGDLGGNSDIGRSLLYFFLREGARFMRLQRDPDSATPTNHDDVGGDFDFPSVSTNDDNGVTDDHHNEAPAGGANMVRTERRRRRRSRSRGRSVDGVS